MNRALCILIKYFQDFGDVIPGHGGIMDRFDCQFLMATFVNVYIHSFIRMASPQKLLQHFYMLKPEEQLQMYYQITGRNFSHNFHKNSFS